MVFLNEPLEFRIYQFQKSQQKSVIESISNFDFKKTFEALYKRKDLAIDNFLCVQTFFAVRKKRNDSQVLLSFH